MKQLIFIVLFISFVSDVMNGQICVGEAGKVTWQCWRNIFSDQFGEMTSKEFYPSTPDITQTIYSINGPVNFDNYFGARITGFIHVPVSDSVQFNVTGNSKIRFYLSLNNQPSQVVLRAYSNASTNEYEYNKYPEQTSSKVYLEANQYYYFEVWYVESTGGDHAKVFWKNNFLANSDWNIITGSYLNQVGCLENSCLPRGTECDDMNANTINDVEDGHCNCYGSLITNNDCVGEKGQVIAYRYENISGSTLNDLYINPNFPGLPNSTTNLPLLGTNSLSQYNNIGQMVQGYLRVPMTGMYKFNITGDDQTIFFLSSDDNPENKQSHQILVSGNTGTVEHNKYIYQSTSNILLNSNNLYYFEINHKEGTGSEHFGIFWQTPFTEAGVWKRIDASYLYNYNCGIACIPQGTPCNDGNNFTNNDVYDDNCNCTGTPCLGEDCDSPLASYIPYEKCNVTDQLDNNSTNNWLSCTKSQSPNTQRESSHWISYDLGSRYNLFDMHVWNYNVLNETDKGMTLVAIDFSEDGENWYNLGEYNWPLATGDSNYGGFMQELIGDVQARYILITSLDNEETCKGLGKVTFRALRCPSYGTPCDDNNPNTINDTYDNQCNCVGLNALVNACQEMHIFLGDSVLHDIVYSAIENVTAISSIQSNSEVALIGGQSVLLDVGFETLTDAVFMASIDPCEISSIAEDSIETLQNRTIRGQEDKTPIKLRVIPYDSSGLVDIIYYIEKPEYVKLKILDSSNNKEYVIVDNEYINKGIYRKRIRTKKLSLSHLEAKIVTTSYTESKQFKVNDLVK